MARRGEGWDGDEEREVRGEREEIVLAREKGKKEKEADAKEL